MPDKFLTHVDHMAESEGRSSSELIREAMRKQTQGTINPIQGNSVSLIDLQRFYTQLEQLRKDINDIRAVQQEILTAIGGREATKNNRRLLTDEQVSVIKLALTMGVMAKTLAKKYKVAQAAISSINTGRTHRDIPMATKLPEDFYSL